MTELSKTPVRDCAEHNAYFPSDYSLSVYTSPVTSFDGYKFDKAYQGGDKKVLMVASDERYVQMKNGKYFSTGNHPVETLLPMMHMAAAGFDIDVATLSGNSVKLEMWAMPEEDKVVMAFYQEYLTKLENPLKLSNILSDVVSESSPYVAVFFPGGHGALLNLPESHEVKEVLNWAMTSDKKIVTLCHGPAALLAARLNDGDFLFDGYEMTVFPDSLDEGANQEIGYMPGLLKWRLQESLEKEGVTVLNEGITGQVHKDRNLLTGDSPLAANALGILAADELLAMVGEWTKTERNIAPKKVLLVTGASKGIGLEIVLTGLDQGYTVVGTSRNAKKLEETVAVARPDRRDQFMAVAMEFDENSIQNSISGIIKHFGRIDVLVNNAGYGIFGALEEFSLEEVKRNFDVNVFGLLAVMQEVLPQMRAQSSGHIINLASISGTVTGPAQSIYSATKASVIMMSESLAEEVSPFNIQVTAICPGGVRTDFLDDSSMRSPQKEIADYQVVRHTIEGLNRLNGNQSGDPKRVAQAILEVAEMDQAPRRLYLNSGAVAGLQNKIQEIADEANKFIELSLSTDNQE